MAEVGRAHMGGDCNHGGSGGPSDGGDDYLRLPSQYEASGGSSSDGQRRRRGKTRQLGLNKIISARKDVPLDIIFEQGKIDTYKPVGDNARHFSSLVGSIVDRLPMNIESWEKVPESFKDATFIEFREYFDMAPWIDGPGGRDVAKGLDKYCSDRYRDHKRRFRERYFDPFGGEDAVDIRDRPPPNMTLTTWNEYVDFYTSPSMKKRSAANKANRAKKKAKGHRGRTSLAQMRHINRDPDSYDPGSPIEAYRQLYSDKKGNFLEVDPERNYAKMVALREAQRGLEDPLSDADIIKTVLRPRRGWVRGIGPKISRPSATQPQPQTQSSQRFFSQAKVEEMITTRLAQSQQQQQQQQQQWQAQVVDQMRREMQSYMKGMSGTPHQREEEGEDEEEEEDD